MKEGRYQRTEVSGKDSERGTKEEQEKLYRENYIRAKLLKWLYICQINKCDSCKEGKRRHSRLRRIQGTDQIYEMFPNYS